MEVKIRLEIEGGLFLYGRNLGFVDKEVFVMVMIILVEDDMDFVGCFYFYYF